MPLGLTWRMLAFPVSAMYRLPFVSRGDSAGCAQLRDGRQTPIAGKALDAGAGHGGDGAVGSHLADAVVLGVSNVEVAV